MTVRDIVREIAKSPEHTQRFYQHILARQPGAARQRAHAELAQRQGAEAVAERIVNAAEYAERFGDWGVPGSGGVRYCAPNSGAASQSSASDVAVEDRSRFAGMDRNGDGVITRFEWRGSRQSFDNQDWNNDGVLSGDEVRPGR